MPKESVKIYNKKSINIYITIVSVMIGFLLPAFNTSCDVRHERGSYFIYGLQWGMTWKECVERLKVSEIKEANSPRGVKIGKAPFFLAGVQGELTLTFKKHFFGEPALKALQYKAIIGTPDTRGEAFRVAREQLSETFGAPTEQKGTVEDITFPSDHGDPYSAMWKNEDGDVYVDVNPNEPSIVLKADANTNASKLAWLK